VKADDVAELPEVASDRPLRPPASEAKVKVPSPAWAGLVVFMIVIVPVCGGSADASVPEPWMAKE